MSGVIDYLCNAFTPDREKVWDDAIAAQGVPIKVRRDPTDSFCEPDVMVARMDELGVATCLVASSDMSHHGTTFEYDPVACRFDDTVGAEHDGLHLVVEADHDDDQLARARDLRG